MPFLSDFMDQFHQELISAAHDKPFQVATAGICIAAVSGLLLFGKRWDAVDYADVIAERVHRRNSVVHKSLKKDRVLIVDFSADASDIRQLYKEGRASVTDVVDQYCVQSFAVGRGKLTAVTEELYDEAHDAAVLLDNLSAAERESQLMNLPLWGIPISIKDCIQQRGTDATCGAAAKCSKPFSEDGLQVSLLRRAGAILHVRSNVPQLLMMPESENNVWGRTVNPWDAARTPGGSSGGEAALIAAGCSVMGLGSDIGGSIRIPAHYCGLVGLKPTPMRITTRGSVAPRYKHRNGQMIIKPVVGPIARSVRDCISMMEALTAPGVIDADPFLPPLQPWNTDLSITGPSNLKQPLKIGMMVTDDWFEAAEACQRAVRMAGNALQDQVRKL